MHIKSVYVELSSKVLLLILVVSKLFAACVSLDHEIIQDSLSVFF